MSKMLTTREHCHMLLDQLGEHELQIVAAILEKIDETADMEFCLQLYNDYQANTDKGEPVDIEDFAKELGITL